MAAVGLLLAMNFKGFVTWQARWTVEHFVGSPDEHEGQVVFQVWLARIVGAAWTFVGLFAFVMAFVGTPITKS